MKLFEFFIFRICCNALLKMCLTSEWWQQIFDQKHYFNRITMYFPRTWKASAGIANSFWKYVGLSKMNLVSED